MVSSVEIAKPKSTHEKDPLKDAGIVSDIHDLWESKTALDATLNTIGVAADVVDMAVNPIKTAVSSAVNWIISHIDPLPDRLQEFTGDPEKVEAAALTWERIGGQWTQAAAELEAAVKAGLGAQVCRTLSAYKVQIGSVIETFRSLGDACKVVAQCLNILSAMVKIVYDLTREAIGDLIGSFIQSATEIVFSLGTATPVVVGQISAAVSKWVARITTKGKQVLNGFREALKSFKKLDGILEKLGSALKKLFAHASDAVDGVKGAAKAGKNKLDDAADGLKGAAKAGKHKLDGAVDALKSKIKSSDEIIDGVARRRKASIDGRLARVDQDAQRAKDALDARKLRVDQEAERMKDALDARKARLGPDYVDSQKAFIDQRAKDHKAGLEYLKGTVDHKAAYEKFILGSRKEGIDESAEAWKRSVASAKDNIRAGGEKLRALHGATLQKPIDVLGAPSDAAEAWAKKGVGAWYRRFGTSEQVAGVDKILKRDELFDLPMKRQRKWIENLNDHKGLWDKSKEVYGHWGPPSQNKDD
ncbi:apolipoprotein A1/A4/E family protein [Schaalia odontolytica]|jgi:hypothetical protein|uniref:apolipoprotein A1/A4/E family protein n=1 Tax=Schaalia odontolytica TaxID=1660 RepID=UPI001D07DE3A|nr:apolipoprotein A1/A4/E family protein [Schaalia odontolytica]MCB6402823.1 apolipoprotein A1/A4/E family protein [Schaalia odontolytica]